MKHTINDRGTVYYAVRNRETGKYLVRNENYRNDRTAEFYEGCLKDCHLFNLIEPAVKVSAEYGHNYAVRQIYLLDAGPISLQHTDNSKVLMSDEDSTPFLGRLNER